jgi:hypothetical protein
MPAKHATVVVVADDGTSPVGTDEWNAGHVGIAEAILAPANGETITAGYSAVVVRKFTIASGNILSIGSGARLRIL